MSSIEPFLRRVQILRWMHNSNGMPSTVREIVDHLQRERFFESRTKAAQIKTVQRDLIELSDGKSKDNQLGLQWAKGEENELKWWVETLGELNFELTKITPDDLLTTLQLAKKHLVNVMPPYAYTALGRYFDAAEQQINERLKHRPRNIARLVERIYVDQRGQRLHEPRSIKEDVLNKLFDALERNKIINITYNGKAQTLHPAGIIIKPPKTYLIAKHAKYLEQGYRSYLVHRINTIELSMLDTKISPDFDLSKYVAAGHADTPLYNLKTNTTETQQIVLRLHLNGSGNLLTDMQETPPFQNIIYMKQKHTYCDLSFESMLTTQLEEWILGRAAFVEVLEPPALRKHFRKISHQLVDIYK